MMSTWNTPTCGSTAATCAPRFAKSAARIDAATVPIGRNGPGRNEGTLRADGVRHSFEGGDEHAVAAVAMGPQPMAFGESVRAGSHDRPERPARAKQGVAHRVGLAPREGADRVDEPATRRQRLSRSRGDR